MENTIQKGKGLEYNSFKIEDKHYFGSYFNLADNNIKEVFNEINNRFGKNIKKPEELLKEIFKDNISMTEYEKWVGVFAYYFPISNYLDKKNENGKEISRIERIQFFRETFIKLLGTIDSLRNFYTHHYHDDIVIDDSIFEFLDRVLLDVMISTKHNYLKTDKTKETIKKSLKDELDILCNLKKDELSKKNNRFKNNRITLENAVYNSVFNKFLDDNNELNDYYKSKQSKILETDGFFNIPISSNGLVFLLSLFLNRKEIESFKSNIKGYKGKSKTEETTEKKNGILFMTTHRIYSILSYKGLKKTIKTSTNWSKETLLMQMVDEISKVPDCIYQHLDKTLQDTFIEDWNEYYKDNEENEEPSDESKVIHPVIRKRYEDKFNYFALRFLDEYANFPTLRFQVYLGNYIHDKREKEIGKTNIYTERVVKDKITVFGKLSELNDAKASYFENEENNESNWEIFPNPSYEFPKQVGDNNTLSNKIGIQVKLKNDKTVELLNDNKKSLHNKIRNRLKPTKSEIIEKIISLNNDTENDKPIVYGCNALAYLSMNDIHSILYESLVKGRSGEELENKIIQQLEKQIQEIVDKDTSSKILKNADNQKAESFNEKKLKQDLQKELNTLKDLLFDLDEKIDLYEDNERAKILHAHEKGEIATWLAKDIKRFMPQGFKEEWKGYQHSEFQASLAYFESSKDVLNSIIEKLDLAQFPFDIKKCFECKTLDDFYRKYLTERIGNIKILLETEKSINKKSDLYESLKVECFSFLKKQNYVTTSLDERVNRILANPIFIERGFIDSKPTMIKDVKFIENKGQFADWFVYFKENDNYQKFYNNEIYPINLDEGHKFKREFYKGRNIQQKNDVFTLLMIKKIYAEIFNQKLDSMLNDFYQTRQERQQSVGAEQNLNFLWNKRMDIKLSEGKIEIKQVKLKNVGRYRKYEQDERVKTFLAYNETIEWLAYLPSDTEKGATLPTNIVARQLDEYEKIRSQELLKEVQTLEEFIYNKVSNKEILKNGKHQNFNKYIVNGLLNELRGINYLNSNSLKTSNYKVNERFEELTIEKKCDIIIMIRNKFAHNQFPEKVFFDYCNHLIPIQQNELYAEYYLRVFKQVKEELLKLENKKSA